MRTSSTILCALLALACKAGLVAAPLNLAMVAAPSSSYCSGDTSLTALNDGYDPRNSADARHGSYGNWPKTGTQWVQYDWTQPIATRQVEVYWWADGRGVGLPNACRLLYWDGKAFHPVGHPFGLGTARDSFDTTIFDEVGVALGSILLPPSGSEFFTVCARQPVLKMAVVILNATKGL